MTSEWVFQLHVFERTSPSDRFQILKDSWWHFAFPRVSKTESLTQYDNIANICRVIYTVADVCKKIKGMVVLMSFAGVAFEWTLVFFFYYIKIQIELLAKINVVNNALVLTGKNHVCSRVKRFIPHTWELILIIDCMYSISSKSLNYASFWQTLIISYS